MEKPLFLPPKNFIEWRVTIAIFSLQLIANILADSMGQHNGKGVHSFRAILGRISIFLRDYWKIGYHCVVILISMNDFTFPEEAQGHRFDSLLYYPSSLAFPASGRGILLPRPFGEIVWVRDVLWK